MSPEDNKEKENSLLNVSKQTTARKSVTPSRSPLMSQKSTSFVDSASADFDENSKFFASSDLSTLSLHQIAREGDVKLLSKLLDRRMSLYQSKKKKINAKDENDLTPLHYAAKYHHYAMMESLIEFGADVQIKGEDDATPLHFLAKYKKKMIEAVQNVESVEKIETSKDSNNCIKLLVDHGADVNARDAMGLTPLHQACARINVKTVVELLKFKSVDVEQADQQGLTALHISCLYGRSDIVKLLLDSGAMIRSRDKDMATPFHLCCTEGSVEVARLLIEKANSLTRLRSANGLNFTTVDENKTGKSKARRSTAISLHFIKHDEGEKKLNSSVPDNSTKSNPTRGAQDILLDTDSAKNLPLHLAIENGNFELVKLSIDEGKKSGLNNLVQIRRNHEDTCFHLAVHSGNLDIMKLLLSENADVNARNAFLVTPLMIGCQHNAYEIVKFLLENGANLELKNSDYMTPLMIACKYGHFETIQCLLDHGASVTETDKDDKTCLMFAAEENRTEALTLLLAYEDIRKLIPEKDKFNNTALHLASMKGHQETVKLLIEHNASVDHKNDDDRTTLHVAALFGHETVIPDLIDNDRSILNVGDEESNTALHLAAIGGNLKSITLLVRRGANLGVRNGSQLTPLDCACAFGWEKIVLVLLESGASIEPKGKIKISPLHLACQRGHVDVLKILLQWKADVSFRSLDGRNALDFAIDFGQKECALILIQHETWLKSMKNAIMNPVTGKMMTPMRKLIMKMQDVAVVACNQCIKDNGKKPENEDYEVTLSYELLDDMYASTEWLGQSGDGAGVPYESVSEEKNYSVYDSNDQLTFEAHTYTDEADVLRNNHPLQIMVNYEREKLLLHPVVSGLLNYKWRYLGRYVYYTNLLIFVAYLVLLNAYLLLQPPFYRLDWIKIFVNYEREKLLLHPVVSGLLNYKWRYLGRYVYYTNLLIFVAYLVLLNAYLLLQPPFYRLDWIKIIEFRRYLHNNRSAAGLNITKTNLIAFANDSRACWYYRAEVLKDSSFLNSAMKGCNTIPSSLHILKWVLLAFTVVLFLREIAQFLNRKRTHFGASNVLEMILYILTLLIIIDFHQYHISKIVQLTAGKIKKITNTSLMLNFQYESGLRQEWQEQVGAIAIFLSWMVLLLFIRKFPRVGIFVVMFTDILKTFSEFFVVFVFFIFSFSFSFTILLGNQHEFERWYEAFVKTTVMMIGELDYGDMFYKASDAIDKIGKDYHSQVYAREVTMLFFLIFLFVMTIIIMNLLVGLAVGDIMVVQEKATLKRLGMQVALALEVEFTLPMFLRKRICKRTQKVQFHKESNFIKRFFFSSTSGLSLEIVSKTLEDEEKDQNEPRSAEDKVLSGLNLLRGRLSDVLAEQGDLKTDVRKVRALVRQSQQETTEHTKDLKKNIAEASDYMTNSINMTRSGLMETTQTESNQTRGQIFGTHRIVNSLQKELNATQNQIDSVKSEVEDKIFKLYDEVKMIKTKVEEKIDGVHQTLMSRNIEELDSKVEKCRHQVEQTKEEIIDALTDLKQALQGGSSPLPRGHTSFSRVYNIDGVQ